MLAILRPYNSTKLAFRSQSCVFIGYSKNHLGYQCLPIPSGRIYIARHVVFNELKFPFSNSDQTRASNPSLLHPSVSIPLVAPLNSHTHATSSPILEPSPTESPHTTSTMIYLQPHPLPHLPQKQPQQLQIFLL